MGLNDRVHFATEYASTNYLKALSQMQHFIVHHIVKSIPIQIIEYRCPNHFHAHMCI